MLAVIHADDENRRVCGTVHLSTDGGKTFPISSVIVKGDFLYSSFCFLKETGELLVLYESDWETIEQIKIKVGELYGSYCKGHADSELSG